MGMVKEGNGSKVMKRKRARAEDNKDQTALPFPNDSTSEPFEPM
jgi:hypothetical protein